jgi:hypothetical protein
MIKAIRYILFVFGVAGVVSIGILLNQVAWGSGILFWVFVSLVFLYGVKRYPREEVFAIFGIGFGFFGLFVLGGAYLLARAEHETLAVVWLAVWVTGLIVFHRPIQKRLTPTFYLANAFAEIVGPIPVKREFPRGCLLTIVEAILFFFFLMVAGLLGPILWVVQLLLLLWFRKRTRGKPFSWKKLLLFILLNMGLLMALYLTMRDLGLERQLRKLLGG